MFRPLTLCVAAAAAAAPAWLMADDAITPADTAEYVEDRGERYRDQVDREEIAERREEMREQRAEALENRIEQQAEAREERGEAREERAEERAEAAEEIADEFDAEQATNKNDRVADRGRTGEQDRMRKGGKMAQQRANRFDKALAESLSWGNQAEIAVSKVAAENAQNESVRQFAEQMVSAHEQMLESLAEYAGEVTDICDHSPSDNAGRREVSADAKLQGQRRAAYQGDNDEAGIAGQNQAADGLRKQYKQAKNDGDQNLRASNGSNDSRSDRGDRPRGAYKVQSMEDVWADATAICLNKTLDTMKQQQGMDFDWAYVSQQHFAHTKMLSELEAMQGRGSERFNQLVSQGIAKTNDHLMKLKQVHQQLEQIEDQQQTN